MNIEREINEVRIDNYVYREVKNCFSKKKKKKKREVKN